MDRQDPEGSSSTTTEELSSSSLASSLLEAKVAKLSKDAEKVSGPKDKEKDTTEAVVEELCLAVSKLSPKKSVPDTFKLLSQPEKQQKCKIEEDKMSVEKDKMSPEKRKMSAEKDTMSKEKVKMLTEKDTLSKEKEQMSTEKGNILTEKDKMSIEKDKMSLEKDKMSIEKDKESTEKTRMLTGKHETSPEKNAISIEKDKSTEKDKMSIEKDKMSIEKDKMSLEKDKMSSEKDKMSIEKDKMSIEKDKMSLEKDKMSTEKKHETKTVSEEEEEEMPTDHVVKDRETLITIAAMYDTTPTKLAQVNRMAGSRLVFPGMKLKLPSPEAKKEVKIIQREKEMVDMYSSFLRLNTRHLTDGKGMVDGSLLATSKVIMFDPWPGHPLVSECGPEAFQIIVPFNLVVNAIIMRDFCKSRQVENENIYYGDEESPQQCKQDSCLDLQQDWDHYNGDLLYMRLIMGQPLGTTLARDQMIVTYGQNILLPEYWFILTPKRAKMWAHYFRQVIPLKYGPLDVEAVERWGYDLVREGKAAIEPEVGRTATRATIEKLQHSHHLSFSASVDFSATSKMIGVSEMIREEHRPFLASAMPSRTDCHDWVLAYTTSQDGFSLANFLRKLAKVQGPILIVMADLDHYVFGAFLSSVPTLTDTHHFQGTGETFLFSLEPTIRLFKWTGENNYFYRVDPDCLIVGSSKGNFGIWMDKDLNFGRSQACGTFDSKPLAKQEDFTIAKLECWTFIMSD